MSGWTLPGLVRLVWHKHHSQCTSARHSHGTVIAQPLRPKEVVGTSWGCAGAVQACLLGTMAAGWLQVSLLRAQACQLTAGLPAEGTSLSVGCGPACRGHKPVSWLRACLPRAQAGALQDASSGGLLDASRAVPGLCWGLPGTTGSSKDGAAAVLRLCWGLPGTSRVTQGLCWGSAGSCWALAM